MRIKSKIGPKDTTNLNHFKDMFYHKGIRVKTHFPRLFSKRKPIVKQEIMAESSKDINIETQCRTNTISVCLR